MGLGKILVCHNWVYHKKESRRLEYHNLEYHKMGLGKIQKVCHKKEWDKIPTGCHRMEYRMKGFHRWEYHILLSQMEFHKMEFHNLFPVLGRSRNQKELDSNR